MLNFKQKKILDKVVLEDKNFIGRDKLYKYVSTNYPAAKISRRAVMHYINQNETFQLYRQKRSVPEIKATLLKRPYLQIGIDLIDMSTWENHKKKWILNSVDLFTRKSWVIALPDKESKTVSKGMEKLINEMTQKPKSLRSDNDSSFKSPPFTEMLKKYNIKHIFSNPNKPQSNGGVEKRNGQLLRQLRMIRTQDNNMNWTEYLQKVNKNLNNQYNTVIKMSPNEAEKKHNEKNVYSQQKKLLRKRNHLIPHTYKVGDKVRIKIEKKFKTKFDYNWSKKIYIIHKVFHPRRIASRATYKLSYESIILPKLYTHGQLLKVNKPTTLSKEEPLKRKPKIYRAFTKHGIKYLEIKYPNEKKINEPYEEVLTKYPKVVRLWEKRNNISWFNTKELDDEPTYIEEEIQKYKSKIHNLENKLKNKKPQKSVKKVIEPPKSVDVNKPEPEAEPEVEPNSVEVEPPKSVKKKPYRSELKIDDDEEDEYLISDTDDEEKEEDNIHDHIPIPEQNIEKVQKISKSLYRKPIKISYDKWKKIKDKYKNKDVSPIIDGVYYNYAMYDWKDDKKLKNKPLKIYLGPGNEFEQIWSKELQNTEYTGYDMDFEDRIVFDDDIYQDLLDNSIK